MKSLRLLLWALFAMTISGMAFGQGCVCATYEKSVTITISEGDGNSAKVDQSRVCLAKDGEITFQSDEGDYEVNFNKGDGTPFGPGVLRGKRAQRMANRPSRPHNVKCGRLYRYTVLLKKGGRNLSLDPEIIIEPSGEAGN